MGVAEPALRGHPVEGRVGSGFTVQNFRRCQIKKQPYKTTVPFYFLRFYGITFHLITVKMTKTKEGVLHCTQF